MNRAVPFFAILALFVISFNTVKSQNLPAWASSYGVETPYPDMTHLTGFGMANANGNSGEALDNARNQAAASLVKKVRVNVTSQINSEITEVNNDVNDRLSVVNRSVSTLQLDGIQYKVADANGVFYALAFVRRSDVAKRYERELEQLQARIEEGIATAEGYENQGNSTAAIQEYLQVRPQIGNYLESFAVMKVAEGRGGAIFSESSDAQLRNPKEMARLDSRIAKKINALFDRPISNMDDAFELMARQFQIQGVSGSSFKVNDFNWQESNFSSEFGAFAARKLNTQLRMNLPEGDGELIIRSMYWDEDANIRVISLVQDTKGNEIGSGEVIFPKSSIPSSYEIRPRNAEQALMDQKVMSEEGLTDGGISVEAWTNKGTDDDNLVFRPNDELQMYFRVNQPAHLRLTYILSDGTKILLIDDFYIGLDKVNQVVKAPFVFSPSPPFGVERMIITAYSKKPPSIATTSKTIDSEVYDNVIRDGLKEMMVKTRGIKLKKSSDEKMRVGETSLTFTMMGN